jgi:hypothetical protein
MPDGGIHDKTGKDNLRNAAEGPVVQQGFPTLQTAFHAAGQGWGWFCDGH